MSFLEIRQLSKHWGDKTAVDNLNLSIRQGEFVALLGPSGCGKSTTLNMIAGLEQPSHGQILLNGNDITTQSPGEALSLVNLADQVNKKPGQLSGGQCQRVALARSIVSQAPLCLMDEPLSNLDAKLRAEMRTEIRRLQRSLGLTVIYVTHDQVEAMSMADRIVLLNAGRVEQNDVPSALYERPASLFAASFIGQPPMNLFPLEDAVVGIRPEHLRFAKSGGRSMEIIDVDYHGAESILTLDFDGTPIRMALAGRPETLTGTRVHIEWSPQHQHRFCPQSGQRLSLPDSQAVKCNGA